MIIKLRTWIESTKFQNRLWLEVIRKRKLESRKKISIEGCRWSQTEYEWRTMTGHLLSIYEKQDKQQVSRWSAISDLDDPLGLDCLTPSTRNQLEFFVTEHSNKKFKENIAPYQICLDSWEDCELTIGTFRMRSGIGRSRISNSSRFSTCSRNAIAPFLIKRMKRRRNTIRQQRREEEDKKKHEEKRNRNEKKKAR